jgi:aldehyde dehydrogenase
MIRAPRPLRLHLRGISLLEDTSMATATAVHPGKLSDKVSFRPRYGNYIGGKWVEPASGQYFENITPVTGKTFCEIPRSNAQDIDLALDAAHAARHAWGHTSPTHRANIMNQIAQRMEDNLDLLALAETWDNGKPIRETTAADIPLAIDHWRYFAGCIRAQEGTISEIDHDTVAYHFHEPLGVVGQIIPWNFPILMATWKLAPAIAAGNCVVLKPAEQTPASILVWAELVADLLPPGVLNIVNGFGLEAGKPLASSSRVAKIAFTGETTTGRLIMQYASQNLISSSPTCCRKTTTSSTRPLRASSCSRSTRARSAPAPAARSFRKASTTALWSGPSSA